MQKLVLGIVTLFCAGCLGPGRISVPEMNPEQAGAQAVSEFDLNHDGAIAGAELDGVPGLKAGLNAIDRDKNGQITAEEIAARLSKYQQDKLGLVQIYAQVTLNGQPLEGATVTLLPEAFMGPAVKPAAGKTDSKGLCMFQIDGQDVAGVHCGLFRVQVSKLDGSGQETIPTKYNTNTVLGEEVGQGSPVLSRGISVNLTSR